MGHDVYYFETTSAWPFDPERNMRVCDADYAVPYLARVAEGFGLGARWAYRRSYLDNAWLGPCRRDAEDLLRHADAVFNVAGAIVWLPLLGVPGMCAQAEREQFFETASYFRTRRVKPPKAGLPEIVSLSLAQAFANCKA